MSIASEISRLQSAKAAIRAAIQDKGVTVGESLTFSEYAARIALIEGGAPVGSVPNQFSVDDWSIAPGNESVTINILTLPNNGGSAITALQYRIGSGAAVTMSGTGTGTRVVSGLTNGQTVFFSVRAVNAVGDGTWSSLKGTQPSALSGGAVQVSSTSLSGPSTWGTTLDVTIPPGMVANDRLVLITGSAGGFGVTGQSTGTWENITPVAWADSNDQIWISNAFATVPSSLTLTYSANQTHECEAYSVSGLVSGNPVVASASSSTSFSANVRDHGYTTPQSNTLALVKIRFVGGGVTGVTGEDATHTWTTRDIVNRTARVVRPTSGSYAASAGPVGASSSSDFWAAILAGA